MRFPNKITSYEESVFPDMVTIMSQLKQGSYSVLDLYMIVKQKGVNSIRYIDALDALFALNKIIYNNEKEVIEKC